LPFSAAARQWRVFKVVGRSAVISNVPLSRMCRYLECAVLSSAVLSKVYCTYSSEIKPVTDTASSVISQPSVIHSGTVFGNTRSPTVKWNCHVLFLILKFKDYSTVVRANLCVWGPLEIKGKDIRGLGGVAGKEACTVHTIILFTSGSSL
jgi:hypothetical protein